MKRERRTVRILLLRRKWWGAAACLLAAFAMIWIAGKPAAVGASATERQLPIYCVEKDYKVASLSFDAAWGDVRVRQPQNVAVQQVKGMLVLHIWPTMGTGKGLIMSKYGVE